MNPELAEIRARLEAATPGPWGKAYWPLPEPHYWVGQHDPNPFASRMLGQVTGPIKEEDADFIAHAREDVEYLLGLLEEGKP